MKWRFSIAAVREWKQITQVRHSWNLPTGIDQVQSSQLFLPYTLNIQIGVDYSQWNTTSPFPDDPSSFNVYMMAADQILDDDYLVNYVFPSMTPFPLRRNAHLRGTVNTVVRRVIIPSWTDFLGFPSVRVDL